MPEGWLPFLRRQYDDFSGAFKPPTRPNAPLPPAPLTPPKSWEELKGNLYKSYQGSKDKLFSQSNIDLIKNPVGELWNRSGIEKVPGYLKKNLPDVFLPREQLDPESPVSNVKKNLNAISGLTTGVTGAALGTTMDVMDPRNTGSEKKPPKPMSDVLWESGKAAKRAILHPEQEPVPSAPAEFFKRVPAQDPISEKILTFAGEEATDLSNLFEPGAHAIAKLGGMGADLASIPMWLWKKQNNIEAFSHGAGNTDDITSMYNTGLKQRTGDDVLQRWFHTIGISPEDVASQRAAGKVPKHKYGWGPSHMPVQADPDVEVLNLREPVPKEDIDKIVATLHPDKDRNLIDDIWTAYRDQAQYVVPREKQISGEVPFQSIRDPKYPDQVNVEKKVKKLERLLTNARGVYGKSNTGGSVSGAPLNHPEMETKAWQAIAHRDTSGGNEEAVAFNPRYAKVSTKNEKLESGEPAPYRTLGTYGNEPFPKDAPVAQPKDVPIVGSLPPSAPGYVAPPTPAGQTWTNIPTSGAFTGTPYAQAYQFGQAIQAGGGSNATPQTIVENWNKLSPAGKKKFKEDWPTSYKNKVEPHVTGASSLPSSGYLISATTGAPFNFTGTPYSQAEKFTASATSPSATPEQVNKTWHALSSEVQEKIKDNWPFTFESKVAPHLTGPPVAAPASAVVNTVPMPASFSKNMKKAGYTEEEAQKIWTSGNTPPPAAHTDLQTHLKDIEDIWKDAGVPIPTYAGPDFFKASAWNGGNETPENLHKTIKDYLHLAGYPDAAKEVDDLWQTKKAGIDALAQVPKAPSPPNAIADVVENFHANIFGGNYSHAEVAKKFHELDPAEQAAYKKAHPHGLDFLNFAPPVAKVATPKDVAMDWHKKFWQDPDITWEQTTDEFGKLPYEAQQAFKDKYPNTYADIKSAVPHLVHEPVGSVGPPSKAPKSNLVAKDIYEMNTWKEMADNWGKLSESEQEKFKKTYHGMYQSLRETPHFKGLGIKWDVTDPYQGNVKKTFNTKAEAEAWINAGNRGGEGWVLGQHDPAFPSVNPNHINWDVKQPVGSTSTPKGWESVGTGTPGGARDNVPLDIDPLYHGGYDEGDDVDWSKAGKLERNVAEAIPSVTSGPTPTDPNLVKQPGPVKSPLDAAWEASDLKKAVEAPKGGPKAPPPNQIWEIFDKKTGKTLKNYETEAQAKAWIAKNPNKSLGFKAVDDIEPPEPLQSMPDWDYMGGSLKKSKTTKVAPPKKAVKTSEGMIFTPEELKAFETPTTPGNVAKPKTLSASQNMDYLKSTYKNVEENFAKHSGTERGSIEEHTGEVLEQWEKQLTPQEFADISKRYGTDVEALMNVALPLHDIGKPKALELGDKTLQHSHTIPIMTEILKEEGFEQKEIALATELFNHDMIGSLLQGTSKLSPQEVAEELARKADKIGMDPADFAKIQLAFFQADASSYPFVTQYMKKMPNGGWYSGSPKVKPIEDMIAGVKGSYDNPETFKLKNANPNLGGIYAKKIYSKGDKDYLFKAAHPQKQHMPEMESRANKVAALGGLYDAQTAVQTIEGKLGSVQPLYGNKADWPTLDNQDFSKLSSKELQDIIKHHPVDWLTSNHDAHEGQWLKTDKGIVGIDRGQSWKHFGEDKLSPDYHPNAKFGTDDPVYNKIQKLWKEGKLPQLSEQDIRNAMNGTIDQLRGNKTAVMNNIESALAKFNKSDKIHIAHDRFKNLEFDLQQFWKK